MEEYALTLFREDVSKAQSANSLYGGIVLTQPFSIYFVIIVIFLFLSLCLSFLSFSEYARKERVKGFLVPDSGIIKVYPGRSGNIDRIYVSDGQSVQKGDLIAKVSLSRVQLNGIDLSVSLISSLKSQISLLEQDYKSTLLMADLDLSELNQRLNDYAESIKVLERQKALLKDKQHLQKMEYERFSKIYHDGYLSEAEYHVQEQKLLQIAQEIESNYANIVSVNSQLNETRAEVSRHPHKAGLMLAEIERRKADVKRQLDEIQNGYQFSVVANESGVVTSISVKEGEFISANRPILSIIPDGGELIAELLLPTRSAGFVKLHDEVRLRFEAFPYQRFGHISSEVSRVDKSLVVQGEIDIPVHLSEPVYRVQAKLSKQVINAYGEEFLLKPGMLLEADIILDRRSLLDWLLDPIYSLKGRIG